MTTLTASDLLRVVLTDAEEPWRALAACRGTDPDLFFPEGNSGVKEALEVCAGCEVRLDCLLAAESTREFEGIRGGMTARQRKTRRSQAGIRDPRRDHRAEQLRRIELRAERNRRDRAS